MFATTVTSSPKQPWPSGAAGLCGGVAVSRRRSATPPAAVHGEAAGPLRPEKRRASPDSTEVPPPAVRRRVDPTVGGAAAIEVTEAPNSDDSDDDVVLVRTVGPSAAEAPDWDALAGLLDLDSPPDAALDSEPDWKDYHDGDDGSAVLGVEEHAARGARASGLTPPPSDAAASDRRGCAVAAASAAATTAPPSAMQLSPSVFPLTPETQKEMLTRKRADALRTRQYRLLERFPSPAEISAARPATVEGDGGPPSARKLSLEQEKVLQLVKDGKNVFFTGAGGVGKSVLMQEVIGYLKAKYQQQYLEKVAVTAPTGIAASHIGGCTIHAAMGIGVPKVYSDFNKMWGKKTADGRVAAEALEVLLIDEVSMLSAELFDCLDAICRTIRYYKTDCREAGRAEAGGQDVPLDSSCLGGFLPYGDERVFGGIQLILCGDFFQLPPIQDTIWVKDHDGLSDEEIQRRVADGSVLDPPLKAWFQNRGHVFQSAAWRHAELHYVALTKVFRQRDEEMVRQLDLLRNAWPRLGVRRAKDFFNGRCLRPLPQIGDPPVKPTVLFPKTRQVMGLNERELQALPGPCHVYEGHDFVTADMDAVMRQLKTRGIVRPHISPPHPATKSSASDATIGGELVRQHYGDFAASILAHRDGAEGIVQASPIPATSFVAEPPAEPSVAENQWLAAVQAEVQKFEIELWECYRYSAFRVSGPGCPLGQVGTRKSEESWLRLKIGAQVILLRNLDLGEDGARMLVNGSRGVVTGFVCAVTTKKWLDKKSKDTSETAALRGIYTEELHTLECFLERASNSPWLPIVRFQNGREVRIMPAVFSSDVNGLGVCHRLQLPLGLAWALTIHKSQGMTLDMVEMELGDCFCAGQVYVALSRARGLDGLRIVGRVDWDAKVVADAKVVEFYRDAAAAGADPLPQAFMREDRGAWHTLLPKLKVKRKDYRF